MMKKRSLIALLVMFVTLYALFLAEPGFTQQVIPGEKNEIAQEEESQEKIIPGPQTIKESTGIFVFVAWMWLAIFVLVYILSLKVKEVDRLLEIRYLTGKKK